MATVASRKIESLQVGRGLAALAVVFHHAAQSTEQLIAPFSPILAAVMYNGYLGVDFFFVLSGFIIYYVNHNRINQLGWTAFYVESRLTRIYLPYWPVGVALALSYILWPQLASGTHNWTWFATLTLLPGHGAPSLAVAWTLTHELIFYVVFFALVSIRKGGFGAAAGAAVLLACFWPGTPVYQMLTLIDLEFIFGVAGAWCFVHRRGPSSEILVIVGLVLCGAFLIFGNRPYSAVFGLGVACLLLPIVRAEAAGRFRAGGFMLLLGNASYSLYLIHRPEMTLIAHALRGFSPYVALPILIAGAVATGIVYHLWYELRVLAAVRQRLAGFGNARRSHRRSQGIGSPHARETAVADEARIGEAGGQQDV